METYFVFSTLKDGSSAEYEMHDGFETLAEAQAYVKAAVADGSKFCEFYEFHIFLSRNWDGKSTSVPV